MQQLSPDLSQWPQRPSPTRRSVLRMSKGRIVVAVALLAVVTVVGFVVLQYVRLTTGLTTSQVLDRRGRSALAGKNLLLMGLDSRLDENGRPLSRELYDALHSGDQSSGGENANVLMMVHVPADGGRAVGLSIPRDDYVALPGCPLHQCMGKIKQAYGLAFSQAATDLSRSGAPAGTARVQQQRDAGRRAEVAAVEQFLGGQLRIDHFVEVTMVAFYELAKVVQPVTVCVASDTQDRYSGADFHAGRQQIDAAQAVAFVRQRRDNAHPSLLFTDLDRDRRQQAFIASVVYQLKQAGTLTNPVKLSGIVGVATSNLAIDSDTSLLDLLRLGSRLSGNVTFYTLPIRAFGRDPRGEDVNLVDLPTIQATVRQLLAPPRAATPPAATPSSPAAPPAAVSVRVVSTAAHVASARHLAAGLTRSGYAVSTVTDPTAGSTTTITYGEAARATGQQLAGRLATIARPDQALAPDTVQITVGPGAILNPAPASPTASATSLAAVPATQGQRGGQPPTALTELASGGIPCVK